MTIKCRACRDTGEIYLGGTVADPWLELCPDCQQEAIEADRREGEACRARMRALIERHMDALAAGSRRAETGNTDSVRSTGGAVPDRADAQKEPPNANR